MITNALTAAIFIVGVSTSALAAPEAAPESANLIRFSRAVKARFDSIKRDIVEAAEAVPESEYGFQPTRDVRSFGALIGHVADSQNFFCGAAGGHNPDYTDAIEKSAPPTKAALIAALKASVSACDDVYANTRADNALELVPSGKGDALRGMLLLDNISHDNEHYGNIVTYMRLKGHVPPSTARTATQGR